MDYPAPIDTSTAKLLYQSLRVHDRKGEGTFNVTGPGKSAVFVFSRYNGEDSLMIPQQYGYLNKTRTLTALRNIII